jgi:hypothetical protein
MALDDQSAALDSIAVAQPWLQSSAYRQRVSWWMTSKLTALPCDEHCATCQRPVVSSSAYAGTRTARTRWGYTPMCAEVTE